MLLFRSSIKKKINGCQKWRIAMNKQTLQYKRNLLTTWVYGLKIPFTKSFVWSVLSVIWLSALGDQIESLDIVKKQQKYWCGKE